MVDLLFKWILFMIRFFICSKKGLLLLFQDCLNVVIVFNLKLISLYYLAHIPSIIFLSQFLWSVPVFSMVYRWINPALVSPETPIHLVKILFRLSFSQPSIRCLMRSAYYWTRDFLWIWVQGQYQPWVTSPPPTTMVLFLGSVSDCTRLWIHCSSTCWSQLYPTSQCCKTHSQ